jgi:hypothetical protein
MVDIWLHAQLPVACARSAWICVVLMASSRFLNVWEDYLRLLSLLGNNLICLRELQFQKNELVDSTC